ncbi:hypothetical protein FRC12_017722 [Ceratobasidium sp. 428]|nr:hypothetical protein FRC12_017722 [Ceratobasidium sp. 428]
MRIFLLEKHTYIFVLPSPHYRIVNGSGVVCRPSLGRIEFHSVIDTLPFYLKATVPRRVRRVAKATQKILNQRWSNTGFLNVTASEDTIVRLEYQPNALPPQYQAVEWLKPESSTFVVRRYVRRSGRSSENVLVTSIECRGEVLAGTSQAARHQRSTRHPRDVRLTFGVRPGPEPAFGRPCTKYGGSGNAEDALDSSLEKLGLPSVDLYLIHQPRWAPDLLKTWSELESAHVLGKAKSIGVSNFSVNELKLLVEHGKVIPSVNQIRFHPYNYHENIQLLDYAKKNGIVIESYGGLTPITRLPGGKLDGVLEKIAKRLGPKVTPGQVIFNWIRAKGVVIVTTTSREERIQEYLSIFDLPALTEDEIAAIDEAGKHPPAVDTALSNESVAARYNVDWFTRLIVMLCIMGAVYQLTRFC